MSKERLEEIVDSRDANIDRPIFEIMRVEDVDWLIKQAEQNKCYREAMEFYADKGTYEVIETSPPTDEYQLPIEPVFKTVPIIYYDKGKEARKALEGDE